MSVFVSAFVHGWDNCSVTLYDYNRNDITQAAGQPPPLVFQYEDEKQ